MQSTEKQWKTSLKRSDKDYSVLLFQNTTIFPKAILLFLLYSLLFLLPVKTGIQIKHSSPFSSFPLSTIPLPLYTSSLHSSLFSSSPLISYPPLAFSLLSSPSSFFLPSLVISSLSPLLYLNPFFLSLQSAQRSLLKIISLLFLTQGTRTNTTWAL